MFNNIKNVSMYKDNKSMELNAFLGLKIAIQGNN
jgi:hypothetical protein